MRQRLVLAAVCMAILLDALDLSITQVALPSIRTSLHVSPDVLPWVANAYVLTYGGLLLLGGRVSDLAGRRSTFLAGLALFAVGSLGCGLAPGPAVLIICRAAQGVGAALTFPAAVAILAGTYDQGPERNKAMGIFAAFGASGYSAGLILGGVLTSALGWQWIFLVKVPVAAVVVAVALAVIAPAGQAEKARRRYDVPGAISGTVGPLLIAFAVTAAAATSRSIPLISAAAVAGLVVLTAFVFRERAARDPLIPLSLFRNRTVRAGDLASLTVLAAPFGFAFVTTAYLQSVSGYSPLRTGLALLPGAAVSAVVSRYGAPLALRRVGLRAAGVLSLATVTAGFALLARISVTPSYLAVVLPASLICLGLGVGVAYPAFTVAAVTDVPASRQGMAAGVQSAALQIGGGLGFAVVSAVVGSISGRAPRALVSDLHYGALAGCALPFAGAILALALPGRQRGGEAAADGDE
jgi:EmrB/QacA subfamily drug resistance transporter